MISRERKNDYHQIRINVDNLLKEKDKTKRGLASYLEIAESNLNRKLNNRITLEDLIKISSYIGCHITDLLAPFNIAGTGNEAPGDNTGVVNNTGTMGSIGGNVGGNNLSIGDSSNIKKIMNEEGVGIEFVQSTDSLQQINAHLEARIKDLEILNASQAKTIETMQLLIDMLTKK